MLRYRMIFAAALAVQGLGGCSNDPTLNSNAASTTASNVTFIQVDRIGRPGLKQLYLPYASHAAFNALTPQADNAQTGPSVAAYVTKNAGRSAAIGAYVQALLTPDVLVANLGDTSGRASYLGWETGGRVAIDCTGLTPATFGGRSLTDDDVDTMLGLAYGNLATSTVLGTSTPNVPATIPPDDGKDQNGANGTPNLVKQNVSCANKGVVLTAFPYLGNP